MRVGGAQVSEKHANFLVNATKDATASELRELAETVKAAVRDQFGVTLEEEVLSCGDWD
jgi:UDP-N-acetylmuramate dehydrogenase